MTWPTVKYRKENCKRAHLLPKWWQYAYHFYFMNKLYLISANNIIISQSKYKYHIWCFNSGKFKYSQTFSTTNLESVFQTNRCFVVPFEWCFSDNGFPLESHILDNKRKTQKWTTDFPHLCISHLVRWIFLKPQMPANTNFISVFMHFNAKLSLSEPNNNNIKWKKKRYKKLHLEWLNVHEILKYGNVCRGRDFGFELTEYVHQAPAFTDYSIRKKERDYKRKKKWEKEWQQNV